MEMPLTKVLIPITEQLAIIHLLVAVHLMAGLLPMEVEVVVLHIVLAALVEDLYTLAVVAVQVAVIVTQEALELQVALVADDAYAGGRLVYAARDGSVCVPARPEGSATWHDAAVVHGVTRLTGGVRYGLFLLRSRALRSLMKESESATAAAACARVCL